MMRRFWFVGLLLALIYSSDAAATTNSRGFSSLGTSTTGDLVTSALAVTLTNSVSWSSYLYAVSTGGAGNGLIFGSLNAGGGLAARYFSTVPGNILISEPFSTARGDFLIVNPTLSVWHSLVVTFNGSSTANVPTVYLDGLAVTVSTRVTPVGTFGATTTGIGIGGTALPNTIEWDGKLADFALWNNTVLTANEAKALATGASPLKVRPSALVFYAPLLATTSGREVDWGPSHLGVLTTGTLPATGAPASGYPFLQSGARQ